MTSAASSLVAYKCGSSSSNGENSDGDVELERTVPAAASGGGASSSAQKASTSRQTGIAGFFHNPQQTPQQRRARERRDEQRRQEAAAAVANPTAPKRVAHIDKTRVVRNHAHERERSKRRLEEEEEEEEEGRGERKVTEKKRKRRGPKGNGVASNDRCKSVSIYDRLKEFAGQTLIAENGTLYCEACGRKLLSRNKSTIRNHCVGIHHVAAVAKFLKSKKKQQTSLQMFKDFSALLAGGAYGSTLSPKEITERVAHKH